MAAVTGQVVGLSRLKSKLKVMPSDLELEMRATMEDAAKLVQADVVRSIQGPKAGRFYTRSKLRYQASAPGEPPAAATGVLMRQITVKKANRAGKAQSKLTAPSEYKYLENGTRRMAARPAFGPAVKRNEAKIDAMVKERSRKVLKKGARG